MMCIPSISTASPISSIAPLIFVILLSMIREGIEDLSRHQNDKILNNSPCKIYRDGKFVLGSWTEVLIADILLIEADEIISADCIILSSFNKELLGQCVAQIIKQSPPEPYKGKGIKKVGQYIQRKESKKK